MSNPITRNDIPPLNFHPVHIHSSVPLTHPNRLSQHCLVFLLILQVRRIPHFPNDTVIFKDVRDFVCREGLEPDTGRSEGIVRWSKAGEFRSCVDRLPELCGPESVNEGCQRRRRSGLSTIPGEVEDAVFADFPLVRSCSPP